MKLLSKLNPPEREDRHKQHQRTHQEEAATTAVTYQDKIHTPLLVESLYRKTYQFKEAAEAKNNGQNPEIENTPSPEALLQPHL